MYNENDNDHNEGKMDGMNKDTEIICSDDDEGDQVGRTTGQVMPDSNKSDN